MLIPTTRWADASSPSNSSDDSYHTRGRETRRKVSPKKVVIPKKRKDRRSGNIRKGHIALETDSDSDLDSVGPHEYKIECCFYGIADGGQHLVRVEQEDDTKEEYCTVIMDYVKKGFVPSSTVTILD